MALEYAFGKIQWLAADTVGTDYTVSGLSFQPKAVRFWWNGQATAVDAASQTGFLMRRGVGFATGFTTRVAVGTLDTDNAGSMTTFTAYTTDGCVVVPLTAGTIDGRLDMDTGFLSDGFRLTVDDQIAGDITVFWEAWGGSDITVATCSAFAEPATATTQDVSVAGFVAGATDQVVMFAGTMSTGNSSSDDSGFCIGAAAGATKQWVVCGNNDQGSANADTDGYCRSDECLALIATAGGNPSSRASFTQFNTNGFRLTWAAVVGDQARVYPFLAIKGGSWTVGATTINGNTGSATTTISSLPTAPKGLSLAGRMTAEQAAGSSSAEDRISIGCATGTSARQAIGMLSENGTGNAEIDCVVEYDQVLAYPSATGTLQAAYDVNTWGASSIQLIVDTAGGVASEFVAYVVSGDAAAPAAPAFVVVNIPQAVMRASLW